MPKSETPAIEPETVYQVVLAHSIKVGRSAVHPGPNVKLRGDVIEALRASDPEAVISYEPAKESR